MLYIRRSGSLAGQSRAWPALAALLALSVVPAAWSGTPAPMTFDLPAQPLETSLRTVADRQKLQIVYVRADLEGIDAPALKGNFSAEEAIARLTEGTQLIASFNGKDTVVIKPRTDVRKGADAAETSRAPMRMARTASVQQADRSEASQERNENTANGSDGARVQEVVVTATKRAESVQDVPMSIAVIGHQDIERRGLIGMEDYLRSIPGVNQIDRGGHDNAIVIRGITNAPEYENFSAGPTVAMYFDETPITGAAGMSGPGGVDIRPVDIDRIEVLRGPQGTAWGSASLGGATRMIPVKPRLEGFAGKVAGTYTDTSGYGSGNTMVQGIVNIPVVENKFALRAVGYRYDESGFYRNVAGLDPATVAIAESYGLGDFVRGFVQDDVGRMVTTGGRLAGLWQLTERFDLSMTFMQQKIEQNGEPQASIGKFEQVHPPAAPQGRVRGEEAGVADVDLRLANLVANYDLGWSGLTAAISHIDGGMERVSDLAPILGGRPVSTTHPSANDFESLTAEARLVSQLAGRLQFLAGLFYEDIDDYYLQISDWPGSAATNPYGTTPVSIAERTRDVEQRAIFGELSYALTDKLTATVGGRYFEYDKAEAILRREGGLFGVPIGGTVPRVLESSEGDSTFKAGLSFKPREGSMVYASWSEGFRLGKPDAGAIPAVCDRDANGLIDGTSTTVESTRSINPDFIDNYELGGKFLLFDRRMAVDAAVYRIQWDGVPIRVFTPTCPGFIANVGSATSTGVEFQASLFVTEGLRLDFGAGYTQADLAKDAPTLPGAPRKGARLPGAPEMNANLAVQYDFPVREHDAFVRLDALYTGRFYGDLLESPLTRAGDYFKLDTRAGVAIKNLSVELFVRNLTNEDAFTWRALNNANAFFGYRLRPRTIGIQLGYSFE